MASAQFDPCRQWLGIDAVDLADPRRVLGLLPSESDPLAVLRAAEARISLLRGIAPGPFDMARNALINRVEEAREAVLSQIAAAPRPAPAIGTTFQPPPPPAGAVARPAVPMVARPAGGYEPAVPPAIPAAPAWGQPEGEGSSGIPMAVKTAPAYRKQSSWSGGLFLLLAGLAAAAGGLVLTKMQAMPKAHREERQVAVAEKKSREEKIAEQNDEPEVRVRKRRPAKPRDPNDTTSDAAVSTSPPLMPDKPAKESAPREEEPPADDAPPMKTTSRRDDDDAPKPTDEEPMDEPMVEPSGDKSDEPTTEPTTEPSAEPSDGEKESDEMIRQADAAIRETLEALQKQEFDAAALALDAAAAKAESTATRNRIARWKDLATYSKGFADYRDQAIATVEPGHEYNIDGKQVGIVEIDDQKFIYRDRGKNVTKPRDNIPAKILMAIVTDWFDANPANNLYIGAYYATKPEPNAEKAREYWNRAQAGGADASTLLPLLDDPVLRAALEDDSER